MNQPLGIALRPLRAGPDATATHGHTHDQGILRLKYQGNLSHERIAQSLSISKGAVAKYLSLAGGAGLDWASTAELDEASLERRLMGGGAALSRVVEPDYARVHSRASVVR